MAKTDKHFYEKNKQCHNPIPNSTEGGSCLVGHEADFSNFALMKDRATPRKCRNSCNYRYQAYEQAKNEKTVTVFLHSYKDDMRQKYIQSRYQDDEIKTSAYNKNPARYCASIALPNPDSGDWDVGGPKEDIFRENFKRQKVKIPAGCNFTQDTWPYWNNAHHLIPKGTLKNAIRETGDDIGSLMEKGLLEAKYNINHKINMLFLPQDKEVGEILSMPRHIQLKEGDDDSLSSHCVQHPVYDKMIKEIDSGLDEIIMDYKTTIENALEGDCETPDFELSKKKLEELSEDLLVLILSSQAGRSLDSISKQIEAK
ncbi:MAG: AHH domain-containing protein [Gammaproteobacteria bacterium]|nr:AHH domain-containing protein [Gammaproteobacteria bacterium]